MAITVVEAKFVLLIIEGSLFGFSVFMFGETMWVIRSSHSSPHITRVMMGITILLFILSVLHFTANAIYVTQGFIGSSNPQLRLLDIQKDNFLLVVYLLQTLVAGALLIWRCWVVWERNLWVIVLPILGWMAVLVAGIGTIYIIDQPGTNAVNIFQITIQWTSAFYGSAMGTNSLVSGLLAFRIWKVVREASQYRTTLSSYASCMLVTIVECGAVYSAPLTTMLVAFLMGSNSAYLIINIVGVSIPLTFYLVILRLALTRGQGHLPPHGSYRRNLHDRHGGVTTQTNLLHERSNIGDHSSLKTPDSLPGSSGDLEMRHIEIRFHTVSEGTQRAPQGAVRD